MSSWPLQELRKGETVHWQGEDHVPAADISAKHKFFAKEMQPGEQVIMYGVLVGTARQPIPKGGLMTTDNVVHAAAPFVYRPGNTAWSPPDVTRFAGRTFNGYHRSDGRVGTANYWLFIPTVFCENRNLDVIRAALHRALGYAGDDRYSRIVQRLIDAHARGEDVGRADLSLPDPVLKTDRLLKNVDGIKFLNHPGGCGGTRQDAALAGPSARGLCRPPERGRCHRPEPGVPEPAGAGFDGRRARHGTRGSTNPCTFSITSKAGARND